MSLDRPVVLRACGSTLLVALVLVACSSDDKAEAIARAVGDHAEILCERLFACCTEQELADIPFVDDRRPASLASCIEFHRKTAEGYASTTDGEEGAGRLAVHIDESEACADATRSLSCSDFHARLIRIHLGDAFALCSSAIVEPLVENGGDCKLYLDCTSGYCELPVHPKGIAAPPDELGKCKAAPKKGEACPRDECASGLRCDPDTKICAGLVGKAGACQFDDECASGACRGGQCVSPGRCGG